MSFSSNKEGGESQSLIVKTQNQYLKLLYFESSIKVASFFTTKKVIDQRGNVASAFYTPSPFKILWEGGRRTRIKKCQFRLSKQKIRITSF